MPIELQYRDAGSGVVFVCTGVVTADEFTRANEEVYSEESLDRLQYQLIDFSDTEHLESSLEDTRKNATVDTAAANQNRNLIIAVAGSDDLTFGISRMWQALTSNSNLRTGIFRSVPDAEHWIKETLQDA
ncbi:MAG: hypothetical protein JRE38_09830 [Deltaproteobacteria bacterium]|nr:hypothetical protein [Deltaproteobacteria bacterium]MBW2693765.1 hypothetical protein [Deltaproteobacteria bacterium]